MDEWINKVRYIHMCAVLSRSVLLTLWTATHQAPLSVGILQARILEWVAMPYSWGSSQPRDRIQVLPHFRQILYHLSHLGSPSILQWVAYPFSRRTSRPRNQTRVSCTAGRFFTSCATREAQLSYIYIFIGERNERWYYLSNYIPGLCNWANPVSKYCSHMWLYWGVI